MPSSPSNEAQVFASDQNEREYKFASAVAPHVMLKNIYVKAISAEMNDPRAQVVSAMAEKDMSASVKWNTSHLFIEESLSLDVRLDFNVSFGQKPSVSMLYSYVLEYGLDSPPPVESREALLSAFAKVNGAYNAWPYLREIVQTTCARMSIPTPLLPIYRVIRPKSKTPENVNTESVADKSG